MRGLSHSVRGAFFQYMCILSLQTCSNWRIIIFRESITDLIKGCFQRSLSFNLPALPKSCERASVKKSALGIFPKNSIMSSTIAQRHFNVWADITSFLVKPGWFNSANVSSFPCVFKNLRRWTLYTFSLAAFTPVELRFLFYQTIHIETPLKNTPWLQNAEKTFRLR